MLPQGSFLSFKRVIRSTKSPSKVSINKDSNKEPSVASQESHGNSVYQDSIPSFQDIPLYNEEKRETQGKKQTKTNRLGVLRTKSQEEPRSMKMLSDESIFIENEALDKKQDQLPEYRRRQRKKTTLKVVWGVDEGVEHQRFIPMSREEGKETDQQKNKELLSVNISNKDRRYRLKHGQEFKSMLDARDQVMEHYFDFDFVLNKNSIDSSSSLFKSRQFNQLILEIKSFLAESVGNIVSADFKNLIENKLEAKEAKAHASKNIMLNMHSIYRQTINAFSSLINDNIQLSNIISLEKLKKLLVIKMDEILKDILINLADHYPQAPSTGGNTRLKEAVMDINRADDEKHDFFITEGIKISEYMDCNNRGKKVPREDGDYTPFVMKVFNSIIEATQNSETDSRKRTISDLFAEFNHHLVWTAQNPACQKIISNISRRITQSSIETQRQQIDKKMLTEHFSELLVPKRTELTQQDEQGLWKDAEEGIELIKSGQTLKVAQKIPGSVRTFSRHEIITKKFEARHSSVLRVLTKWAGYLQAIFLQPEEHIMRRTCPFKDINNEEFIFCNQKEKLQLIDRLREQHQIVRREFADILATSYEYIGQFMAENSDASMVWSISRFAQTRKVSSKVSAILTALMLKYTNLLIHHLLIAGKDNKRNSFLNLVCFRVSDLLRSKLYCKESNCITLLKTMYALDSCDSMKNKFKLVRVKNKLDEPSNNLIVNYLFMGKVQCELQLSVSESKGKEKGYYTFSHFVYELTRGRFSSIAECALMVAQLDPLISACPYPIYSQKKYPRQLELSPEGSSKSITEKFQKQSKQTFFKCEECKQLVVNQHVYNLLQSRKRFICYQCVINFTDRGFRVFEDRLQNNLDRIDAHRRMNFADINCEEGNYLIEISPMGKVNFYIPVKDQKMFRTYLVKADDSVLQLFDQKGNSKKIKFEALDYIDITRQVKESISYPQSKFIITYMFPQPSKKNPSGCSTPMIFSSQKIQSSVADNSVSPSQHQIPSELLTMANISASNYKYLPQLREQFINFRIQKNLIKRVKQKLQAISLGSMKSRDKEKERQKQWQIVDKVCCKLVLARSEKIPQQYHSKELRYTKYKQLDLDSLKVIEAERCRIAEIPRWLKKCFNLKRLNLDNNQISHLQKGSLPPLVESVSLCSNKLRQADVSYLNYLKKLSISNNYLEEISIGKNISVLNLEKNRFKQFNVGENHALVDLNLSENKMLAKFDMENNSSITCLNLIANENLTHFVSNHNTNLEKLMLTGTQNLVSFKMGHNKVTQLHLQNQKLKYLDLTNNTSLQSLSTNGNSKLKTIKGLPSSLRTLRADRRTILGCSLGDLIHLEELRVYNGWTHRQEIADLRDDISEFISQFCGKQQEDDYDELKSRWKLC